MKCNEMIRKAMHEDGKRFWAGDNVSEYVNEKLLSELVDEATVAFESVLDSLLIDRENDPNSHGTARRLAKMYFYEIMAGRYSPAPNATAARLAAKPDGAMPAEQPVDEDWDKD